MKPVEDLCRPLARNLWSVHGDLDGGPRLIFPVKRSDIVRVSEQESKILLCQVLETTPWFYSVETPTRETYMQSGTHAMSARVDVTVYASRLASDRLLNIELKAGVPSVENFRKDFEKLIREGVNGLWFHTLEVSNGATIPRLLALFREAIILVGDDASAAGHVLTVAICLLDRQVLLTAQIRLGSDLNAQLAALLGVDRSGWNVFGPGADAFERGSVLAPIDAPAFRAGHAVHEPLDRSVREKLLIFCPQITDDTLLHFSQVDDSYRLRAFVGRLVGRQAWTQPDTKSAATFLQTYLPIETFDVRHERISVEKKELWAGVVAGYNRRIGIG
jgi:hypothetical protein